MPKPDPSTTRHSPRPIRCAIYTRKSSEEGLEQDFNSLHAQREVCTAFVTSQRHEGWVILPEAYDDGGISGATLERPALQQLLADIAAGKIDTVVVYKVDRLTRTLVDFAKIVEIFDAQAVAFVSVTQQFNTTTSMGRLILNVLLSFAQFEREVTGERIRDKIAASKRKGMWMGGYPPLGYDVRDRKLAVNEDEAVTVRHIFQRYTKLRSVRSLKEELEAAGIASKQRTSVDGRQRGGQPLARGALYRMLQNRLYRGEIVHKDQHYPGEHKPIVDPPLWDQVQAVLADNGVDRQIGRTAKASSLLAGLIHDGDGHRMIPSHAVKEGKHYRYYVSHPLITEGRRQASAAWRVPAAEIEQAVADHLCAFLADAAAVFDAVSVKVIEIAEQKRLVERAQELAYLWPTLLPARQRGILCALIYRIEVTETTMRLHLMLGHLPMVLETAVNDIATTINPSEWHLLTDINTNTNTNNAETPIVLDATVHLTRIGQGIRLIVQAAGVGHAKPNPAMVRLLAQAHQVQRRLLQGRHASIKAFAEQEGMTGSYIVRLIRLAWLAPTITQAILTGQQPPALTAIRLMQGGPLPIDWQQQRQALGFR